MDFKNVTVAGSGVLGSQIAFQTAFKGFDVTIWLRSEGSIERAKPKLERLKGIYLQTMEAWKTNPQAYCRGFADSPDLSADEIDALKEKVVEAFDSLKMTTSYEEAAKDADLIIEAIAEDPAQKIPFYEELAKYMPEKTVLVTNSSTLLPSAFAEYTGRPEKYLSLHFANTIWVKNTAEVMSHDGTNKKYFDEIMEFATSIRMLPLPVLKEKSGYLLNSMLVPFLLSGMDLLTNGISDAQSIDIAWKRGTGAPKGPFEIIDTVGLTTAKNIVEQYQKVPGLMSPLLKKMMLPYNYKGMLNMLNQYIEEGKLGKSSGEGFYKYDKS